MSMWKISCNYILRNQNRSFINILQNSNLNVEEIWLFLNDIWQTYFLSQVNETASAEKVCLLGCGISTGYGAALNTAKVSLHYQSLYSVPITCQIHILYI